jgi:hypothetical protein
MEEFGFADHPAFYLELRMKPSDGRTAVTLTPQYFEYAATSAKYSGSGQKSISLVIQIAADQPTKPGDIANSTTTMVFRHNLGRLEIGRVYSAATTTKLFNGTAAWQKIPDSIANSGSNITALVTESEDPSVAFTALVDAFQSKKGDLQTAIEQAIKNALGGSGTSSEGSGGAK